MSAVHHCHTFYQDVDVDVDMTYGRRLRTASMSASQILNTHVQLNYIPNSTVQDS